MNKKVFSSLLFIAGTLLWAGLSETRADTVALTFSNDNGEGIASDSTLGWTFTLSNNVLLTQLGVWDGNNSAPFGATGDGLLTSHLVSIWTSTGTLVASAVVPAGGGTLLNTFRYVSVAPTLLAAGNYVIGAFYATGNQDRNAAFTSMITTAAGVSYGEGRTGSGNALPAFMISGGGVWGPNFQFTAATSAAPEGGSSVLLLAISGSLLLWKRRRAA